MKARLFKPFCLLFLGLTACKNAVPEIEELRKLDGFSLDQQTISISNKNTPTLTVSGTCGSQFLEIEISFDQGRSWNNISSYATSSNFLCATTGTFSYNLTLGAGLFTASNQTNLHFRGVAALGESDSKFVTLAAMSPFFNSFTAGGHQVPATGGSYKLTGQLVGIANGVTSSGGTYKLKGRLVPR